MDKPRRIGQMIGEALREIAVLWLALYPLERLKFEDANDLAYLALVLAAGIALWTGGAFLERNRVVLSVTEYPIE